jgi:hypothetical protein
MPISEPKIMNNPLTGAELTKYACKVLDDVLKERDVLSESQRTEVVEALRLSMRNDCFFAPQTLHGNVICEVSFQSHIVGDKWAFSLTPKFTLPNNMGRVNEPFVRRPVGVSQPPIDGYAADAHNFVDCFTMRSTVLNPNAVRVRCGMPIVTIDKLDPKPGDLFPKFDRKEHRYPVDSAPPLPEVTVIEESTKYAAKWSIPGYDAEDLREEPVRIRDEFDRRPSSPDKFSPACVVIDPPRFDVTYQTLKEAYDKALESSPEPDIRVLPKPSAPEPEGDIGAEMMAELGITEAEEASVEDSLNQRPDEAIEQIQKAITEAKERHMSKRDRKKEDKKAARSA